MANLDPAMKELFSYVGVSAEVLQDKETADIIYDIIEKGGGIDKVREEMQSKRSVPAPPPPSRSLPEPPRKCNTPTQFTPQV